MSETTGKPESGLTWEKTPPALKERGFMSVDDLAVNLGTTRQGLYKLIRDTFAEKGPVKIQVGKRVFYEYASLMAGLTKTGGHK